MSATSQPQMEAVALNLYTNQPTSGSYMQSSGASTSVVSAALLGFLKNDFANLTTVEILSLVASVGVGPVQDFAKTPLPPYAPVAPAMPLAPPRPGSRIGCSAGPGLSAPFTGAIQDFQIYVPALSSACMGSLVLNSTASCPTAAPPAPTIAPPAPSQQIQPVGTLLSTLDQFVVPGALCGPARQGPIILANQQTCIIGSRAQISALPHGSLSGAGAPTGDRFITMQSGGAFSVSGATVGTGTFKLSWRHTTDQLSAPGAAGAPIITIRQSNGKVLHSSPVRNGLSFKPVNSTCTFDAPSQMIQFSMAGPSGWSVFIDNVVAFGSQPVAGCVVATPPAPPPAPPPSQPPPATMTDSIVVATGLSGVIPTNQARAVRVQGALGSPYLSILTLGGPSSVPSSRASTRVPGGFCGASQSGSTSILLSTPDQAQSILNDMSNGTLPFVPQIQFLSSLQTMALAAQQGGAQQSLGDVANVWSPDGAGGYVGTISNTNPALSGLNCRLCALFSGGPSGVLAMDSGTASMSLLSATVTSLTLGTPPAPPNPAAPNPAPPPPVPKPPQQPPPNPPTPTATPTGTVTFNSGGGSANDYTNNAFRCAQPSLKAVVNQTHVIMTLTSWAEAWGDVKTTDTADGFNAGRAVFTYATFNPTLAATTLWDPANPMPTRQAFGVADSTPALADRYRYNGSCSLSEAGGEPEFTTTANMTLQPQYSGWRPGMTTSNFRNITIQSAGCTCATYSVVGGGVAIPAVGCSGVDSPSNHVFWSDGTQGPWSVRQTTCGADGSPQQCSPATLYSYFPTDNSLVACSLRTESLLVLTLPAFKATLASVLPSAGSSALTLSTEIEIVEVGSTAAVNATHGVDSLQTRYTHSDLVITLLPAAAIVEVIEPGGTANPLLITVQGTLGTYGGPAMVRCLSDSRTVQLVWQTNGYVMQSNAYMTGSPAPIVPDTTFQVSTMMLSKYRVLWNVTGNYSTSCALWVGMPDGQQLPAGNTSTLSCALPGCKPIPTSSLPAFFSATNAVSMAVQSGTFYWTQYYMKVTCNLTAPEPVPDTADYIIPSGIMTVPYALQVNF